MTQFAERPGETRETRILIFYRWSVLFLLVIVVGLLLVGPFDRRAAQGAGETAEAAGSVSKNHVIVADLAAIAAEFSRTHPRDSDFSATYYQTSSASVHMHLLGFEQTCPLHIHRNTHEVTIIVSGTPLVSHIFAHDGELVRNDASYGPGTLIYSPPFCGHRWVNQSKHAMQANLIFAAPPFDGNFYLENDDYRLKRGGKPLVRDPDEALRSFLAGGDSFQLTQLPMMNGRMSSLLVRDEASLGADPSPTLIYVTRGEGLLLADHAYPLRHEELALLVPDTGVRIRAAPDAPMDMIVFKPGLDKGEERTHSG